MGIIPLKHVNGNTNQFFNHGIGLMMSSSHDGKIFDDVSKGRFPEGIESYFPLFYLEKPKFEDFFSTLFHFLTFLIAKLIAGIIP